MAPMKLMGPRVSYADLERAPEDGRRYELYDGEVVVVPSPLPRHQIVAQNLSYLFSAYAAEHGGLALISPIDIVFSEHDVVQPDVVFFEASRRHLVRLDAPIRHAPDLAIEVLSPTTAAIDRGKKMRMLARYGVREYWIVDPVAETIEIYTLAGGAYTLAGTMVGPDEARSPHLPDLSFAATQVFPS